MIGACFIYPLTRVFFSEAGGFLEVLRIYEDERVWC